ncbi:hypothetical protein, conserved [Plasmodium vivax]|uniref:Transcription factor with AP2 domain(S) n=1 Tax=Plasmodium vivax (strain Salvador I) TaxID=126793 RepID=A5K9J1_PLAVS|nr:hypothetical protein, conserved [Plasmodium vivax]EDL44063.1 hypothetical protein, conserved [Plasmodium vivax]|eukprot:XP_001613790.1 hypothetical protein [Plasmodium vivax Sal-1]
METEEGDAPADVGRGVPASGGGGEGALAEGGEVVAIGTIGTISSIGEVGQVFQIDPIDHINPINPMDDGSLLASPGKTPPGEEKRGGSGTSQTGGIKIGINKKDYDLYISQLKDKGVKDVAKSNGAKMRRSNSGGKNECDSDYYDMKHIDGNTTEFFDDADASNKRTINTIISRMDSDLTNTEDVLSKVNENSTTYMSNENHIGLANNEVDITDHANFNPHFEFDEMMGPSDKTTYVENCEHVSFFKNGETDQVGFRSGGCKAGEESAFHAGASEAGSHQASEGGDHHACESGGQEASESGIHHASENGGQPRRGDLVEEPPSPELNNPVPLNTAEPFAKNEQQREEDKLPSRVNPTFGDLTHLSQLPHIVSSTYAFLENEELTSRLNTFCSRVQNGEATSGGGPPHHLDGKMAVESKIDSGEEVPLLVGAQQGDLPGGPSTQRERRPGGDHFYNEGGSEQEEENGGGSERSSLLKEKATRKRKKSDEEDLRNGSKDAKILLRQREQNNVDVRGDYTHLYEEAHKDIIEECLRMCNGERRDPGGCAIRRTSHSSGGGSSGDGSGVSGGGSCDVSCGVSCGGNVGCSSGETLPSNVALNSGGEKDGDQRGGQGGTPPREGGHTDDLYDEAIAAVKKVGRRVGRKSKNCAHKSGEANGDAKGKARMGLRPSGGCDVDAAAECAADEEHMGDTHMGDTHMGDPHVGNPHRDHLKENGEEEQPNGSERGRAKHGNTSETYARRPLRNAAKKCIHLWSEELKKKNEKHNAALERSKHMSDQRKEERAMRRKERVIKNGSKVIPRGGLARGYGGRGWARGEAKSETKFAREDANGSDAAEEEEGEEAEEMQDAEEGASGKEYCEEGAEGASGKAYCEEGQEGTHRRARGRPSQRTGSHTDPKVRERNQGNESYGSSEVKSDHLSNEANERGTKGGRKKNDLASLGQEHNNIPILFNDTMDEREMFKYLDLLRHLPSKKGGAQYKLHKAILTEEMVRRAKKFPLVQGVYFDRYQQRWSVNWNEDGKRVAKYFPIKLFGFDYARRLAIYCKNYQKIPEEALIFEQAYRASQQSNKHRNDPSEGVVGGVVAGANVGVSEVGNGNGSGNGSGSANGSGNGSANGSWNGSGNGGGRPRRGAPKKGYKKRGLRKQDNSNEDKSSSGYGKRRKNINSYPSGGVGSSMNEGPGDNEGACRGPGQIPPASNYSGSANSGVSSGANDGAYGSEKRDSSYRSDGGAKEVERSGLPKVAPYFPGGSLPGSQGAGEKLAGEKYLGGLNHPSSQHTVHPLHTLQSIWGGLGNMKAPSAANEGGLDQQLVQGYLLEGDSFLCDFQGGAKHGHLGSGHLGSGHLGSGHLGSGHPGSGNPGSGNPGSGHPNSGHVKEEQKNVGGIDGNADRTDVESMLLMRQRMMMLEQGRAANASMYMPFGSATMGFPITHSSNELRRFGSGDTHFEGEKKSSGMNNMVGSVGGANMGNVLPFTTHSNHPSEVIQAGENHREMSSSALPHMMMMGSCTVEGEEKKRERKKGEAKKNHFVCTSTGASSFKSSASHISSTSSCYKNMEVYLSSNGPFQDMGEALRWRKGGAADKGDAADKGGAEDVANVADAADAALPSTCSDQRGSYHTANQEAKRREKSDAPSIQGAHQDNVSRGEGNSHGGYLLGGKRPPRVEEEPEEGEEDDDAEDDDEGEEDEEGANPREYVPRGRGGIAPNVVTPAMEKHTIEQAVRSIMPKEESTHKGVTHLNSIDGVSQVGGEEDGRSRYPHGVGRSTVEGGQRGVPSENEGNKMEDIFNISKYSEIVSSLEDYNLISRMSQMGVKMERGLFHLGGLNFKRENTEGGASRDGGREEVPQKVGTINRGEVPQNGDSMNRGEVPNGGALPSEDASNGGDLTQESNPNDINSRIVGVHYDRKQYRWKATWYTSHGRRCAKYYPIKQYGYLEAKKMAIECRRAYNAYKKLKKGPENGIEEGEFNFESIIFPKEYYITLFENDEKKDGYFWNPKRNKKTGKKSPFLDNNEKQRRHYNEALKKITNVKCKDLSQLNEFMKVRKNDGETSTYASVAVAADPVEASNVFAQGERQGEERHWEEQQQERQYRGGDYPGAQMEAYQGGTDPFGSYKDEPYRGESYHGEAYHGEPYHGEAYPGESYPGEPFQAAAPPSADSAAPVDASSVDAAPPPILENEQNEEWSTRQGGYTQGGMFQDGCCSVVNGEGHHVPTSVCSAHVAANGCPVHVPTNTCSAHMPTNACSSEAPANACSAQNVSSLLSLYYLSENILKFQKGTIKCILQDLRDNCLSNLAYDIKNITFQEYYMAIHYLNRYVEDSNCYDDIFFLLKILAKNLEIRKIPSLYNEEEQKELLNSLTVITKQMKSGYSFFTPGTVRSASEGGEAAAGVTPSDRFSVIFQ